MKPPPSPLGFDYFRNVYLGRLLALVQVTLAVAALALIAAITVGIIG